MQSARAIELLERQRSVGRQLQTENEDSAEFTKWRRDTEIAIEHIFGVESRNVTDFKSVSYTLNVWISGMPESAWHRAYVEGLRKADAILASMIDEVREYDLGGGEDVGSPDQLSLIEKLCLRFHAVARQLQARHADRETLSIEDEYDVQDLLHALLRLHFDDIRPEEWTPSYAGSSARVDFLLKNERIVIEVKKTRSSLRPGKLGEELIVDRARYGHHPDCDTLVCFVYDPEARIGNPVGLERDLENHSGKRKVQVIVAPKT